MTKRSAATVVGLTAVALLLSACAGGGSPGNPGSTGLAGSAGTVTGSPSVAGAATAPSGVSPSTSTSTEPAPTATVPVSGAALTEELPLAAAVVEEIRAADHGSFDRVVIQFKGTFGAWSVEYVDKVVNDPEGSTVPLKGNAFAVVRVSHSTYDNLFQVGSGIEHLTYTGPHRISTSLPNVQELADAGDFEAEMGLGVGLQRKAGLRAYRLENPARLVVDIAH
jgi:hypothetical protein